jgi:hypothetical protein
MTGTDDHAEEVGGRSETTQPSVRAEGWWNSYHEDAETRRAVEYSEYAALHTTTQVFYGAVVRSC